MALVNNVAASAMDAALNGEPFQERDLAVSYNNAVGPANAECAKSSSQCAMGVT